MKVRTAGTSGKAQGIVIIARAIVLPGKWRFNSNAEPSPNPTAIMITPIVKTAVFCITFQKVSLRSMRL